MLLKVPYFFLLLFVAFLCTPALVSWAQEDKDHYVVSLSEEDADTDCDFEAETDFQFDQELKLNAFVTSAQKSEALMYILDLQLGKVYLDLVAPPPKFS